MMTKNYICSLDLYDLQCQEEKNEAKALKNLIIPMKIVAVMPKNPKIMMKGEGVRVLGKLNFSRMHRFVKFFKFPHYIILSSSK